MKVFLLLNLFFNAVNCAKILGYFHFPSISHQFVFQAIVRELSLRGHQVTFLSPNNIRDPKLINLTEIDLSATYKIFEETDLGIFNRNTMNMLEYCLVGQGLLEQVISIEMEMEQVKNILTEPEHSYDLIIIEALNPFHFGLQHKFKAPVIAVSSFIVNSWLHTAIGNQIHPVLHPEMICSYPTPLKYICEKFDSLYTHTVLYLFSKFYSMSRSDELARKYFGEDMPYLEQVVKNVSVVFANVNPIFSQSRSAVPKYKEVWNIHLKQPQLLGEDLQQILDGAKNGLVYFSLGTNVRFEHVDVSIKEEIMKALGDLPYTVLCKWESEEIPGKPKNVILRKWLPQQSILAHPNVKIFVTQGGLQSAEEAIFNGLPLVVIPFSTDQPHNAKILTRGGMAETIQPDSLERNILRDTILQVATNEKYRLKAQEFRSILLDQPRSGLDEIVWWCEYVIRHKGAHHLDSPSADISIYEYFMLDVLGVICVTLFAMYKVFREILKIIMILFKKIKCRKQKQN
ncbi:hypothetical protein HHI36_002716 [Cryptolaemus montrouzieri]|uniref:Glucuronosyltransferase n=1 Tax=Cryptolaemus montrouzieri TaxID=559131 RepID=A0ABD2PBH0_9CUCU